MMRRLTEQELRELSGKIIDVLPDGVDPLDLGGGVGECVGQCYCDACAGLGGGCAWDSESVAATS